MRRFNPLLKRKYVSTKQYDHTRTLGALPLPAFPTSLLAPEFFIIQTAENCTAYSGVNERRAVTGTQYQPDVQWEEELKFLGVPTAQGVTLDTKMQVGTTIGFTPVGATVPQDKAAAYFWVNQVSNADWFDSVRLAFYQLNQKYGKVIPITIGVNWYNDWDTTPNGILTMNPQTLLGGHDIELAGFETFNGVDYLIAVSTWGQEYGDQGIFRIPRNVFNAYFEGFGAAYWSDDTTTPIAKMNLLVVLYQNLITLYKALIASKTGYPPPIIPTPLPIHASLIPKLVQGIFIAEGNGAQAGVKYNNRGDLRGKIGNKYLASLGVTGYGENNLAIFPTMEIGDVACTQLCTDVANEQLLAYPKPCSITQFVKIYGDPQTQAEWDDYVAVLCKTTGKVASTNLSELL